MSEQTQTEQASAVAAAGEPAWQIRTAEPADARTIASAIGELLAELGGTPPPLTALREATNAWLDDPERHTLLVADSSDGLVGVLATSWQLAIHVPGRYGLIQDLWVSPTWRSRAIGAALLQALFEHASKLGVGRLEVGLPKASFVALEKTESFYRANGFVPLGSRMRVAL